MLAFSMLLLCSLLSQFPARVMSDPKLFLDHLRLVSLGFLPKVTAQKRLGTWGPSDWESQDSSAHVPVLASSRDGWSHPHEKARIWPSWVAPWQGLGLGSPSRISINRVDQKESPHRLHRPLALGSQNAIPTLFALGISTRWGGCPKPWNCEDLRGNHVKVVTCTQ